jgi:hypothetical protein
MPNWCENDLTITGPEKDVYAFFDEAHGKEEDGEPLLLDFNKFVPQPGTITRDLIQHPLFSNRAADRPDDELWYYWRLQHWGTKWQPDSFQVDCMEMSEGRLVAIPTWNSEAKVMVTFDTAWSPPLPVVLAMSKKFPTLEFELRYFEGGCCFNGLFVCEGGEVKVDKVGDYFGNRGG